MDRIKVRGLIWPPIRKQYFFSRDMLNSSSLKAFYTPYSLPAKILFKLFVGNRFLQFLLMRNKRLSSLRYRKDLKGILLNYGTGGIHQKETAVVRLEEGLYFQKSSTNQTTYRLVKHEAEVLKILQNEKFVPKLIFAGKCGEDYVYRTEVLAAGKYKNTHLNSDIINLSKTIMSRNVSDLNLDKSEDNFFSHGDFTPWNILITESGLVVVDWEYADMRPKYYDLNTYFFQTQFLLGDIETEKLLLNYEAICAYNNLPWPDILSSLESFCNLKLVQYTASNNPKLYFKYKELLKVVHETFN